jgi:NAD dependent epimerase/dehydratase
MRAGALGTAVSSPTALITGAGGFIGSHLAELLVSRGVSVKALVRYNSRDDRGALGRLPAPVQAEIEAIPGDVRDVESVSRAMQGAETVFHLAAQIAIPYSYINPRDFFETNVMGSLNVAQAARAADVQRVVHTSTSEVYGSAVEVPMTESHPLQAQSPYAASKSGADSLMQSFHRSFGLPVVIVRPFNTYGPRQSTRAVIPTIITQALRSNTVRLGALTPRRDLTYVTDTARGLAAAATASDATGRTIHLGTGKDVSVGELVTAVGELLGKSLEVEEHAARIRPANSEVDRLLSSPALAGQLLGWSPEVDLSGGLSQTVRWLQREPAHARPESYVV